MTRAPYRPIEDNVALRPAAAPTESFVRTAEPPRDNALIDLAQSLYKLDAGLSTFVESRKAERDKEDALRGEAEFHKNNRLGYAEAVAQGKIPAFASKSFVSAYKQAQGSVAGYDLEQKFNAAYDAWGGKNADNPTAYEDFIAGFLKDNIQTDDPDVLRGLLPRVRGITEGGMNRFQHDLHERTMNGSVKAHVAEVDNAIDEENTTGLGSEKGPDYQKLFGSIHAIRQKALDSGMPADKLDPQIVDAVTSKAIELRDPKVLDFLDQNVPGTSYSWKDTPYGRKAKAETIEKLEVMGRRAIAEEAERQTKADKKAKDDVTRRTVEAIIANPNGPLPDELLAEGSKYDPDFKINALKWKGDVLRDRGTADPEALRELNWEILNGGGMAVIRRGMEMGIFANKEDLVSAYKLLQDREKNGAGLDEALNSSTARSILGAINSRTQDDRDVSKIFNPEGITDKGLAAQYDFKRSVMLWLTKHPDASHIEQETAINDIGAQILKRIEDYGVEGNTYNRGGFSTPNPFQQDNPGNQPQEPTAQPQDPTPQRPSPAPSAAPTQQPEAPEDPEEYSRWVSTLTPQNRAQLEARATQTGQPANALLLQAYRGAKARGLIAPANPQEPAPKPQQQGALELPATPASLKAGNPDIMSQVSNAIQQWSEDDPVAQDVINQVGSLIEQAINGHGDYNRNFELAVLKDDPRAARILDFIAGPESRGNYNAYFAHTDSTKDLSKMTLDQIIAWQKQRVAEGSKSSATGRYQFMRKTLEGLKKQMGLTGSEKFTPLLQDQMALQLMRGRGYDRFKEGKMSAATFANELAKEWASLPNLTTGKSHYDGDGLNKSLVSPGQVLDALDPRRA